MRKILYVALVLISMFFLEPKSQEPIDKIPTYFGEAYVEINGNKPYFDTDDLTTQPFESYSNLDALGRAGAAYANICKELMPTDDRQPIGNVKPSGWQTSRYDDLVEGNYLYNRSHLIGFQLAGENANEKNLITGTRAFNVEGMLPFENMVDNYVEKTNHHVLYRVTPIYTGNNLVADGVLMEAQSVEDNALAFNVFIYNVQKGVQIDYQTGKSKRGKTSVSPGEFILNDELFDLNVWITPTGSSYHAYSNCSQLSNTKQVSKNEAITNNYQPCKKCY